MLLVFIRTAPGCCCSHAPALLPQLAALFSRTIALEGYEHAANIARKLGAPEQFARSALGSGSWAMGVRYGTVDQVQIALLEEALDMQAEPQSPLRAKLLAQLALACYHMPGERRLQLSQDALEMRLGIAGLTISTNLSEQAHAHYPGAIPW